ncbi:hypothetical protein [Rhizobium sp. RAF56]|uniref:hypothetical protein n=1 Tax=Rhizobium sp. RAF56 TaxID=3233062 RepID=UPI003F9AC07A
MTKTDATHNTSIKIFYGSGWDGLQQLQEEVNDWLDDQGKEVISLTPSVCSVGDPNEMYQGLTVTVWYRDMR